MTLTKDSNDEESTSNVNVKLNLSIALAVIISFGALSIGMNYSAYMHSVEELETDGNSLIAVAELSFQDALWDMDNTSIEELSEPYYGTIGVIGIKVTDLNAGVGLRPIKRSNRKVSNP